MRRRPREVEPPPMPPEIAVFSLADWVAPDDDDPALPRAAASLAERRWVAARNAWCREHNFDQLAAIREARARRRAAAGLPREGGTWS